ncbi:phospholipase D-like domain-containing protein [Niabella sp. 22666]|uniref:phospholipase D-like domain-containing protein n=1 Tax=Niabella sp. 22666 TaxID=3453954 RepID=UPI003F878BDB
MRLLEAFKKLIREVQPEICWFTTFNLNVEFLEKYILAAIAGKDPSELKRAEDYEHLNEELVSKNIRVWYDFRAMDLCGTKRTTVDLHPVNAAIVTKSEHHDSIFHPKIIFLKGKEQAYLMTGSFNLTVAGWASNKESVIIRRISSRENASQVIDFFESLTHDGSVSKALLNWRKALPDHKSDWQFYTSLQQPDLLNALGGRTLYIWSPYFSAKTHELIRHLLNADYQNINIIPDVDAGSKVRIEANDFVQIAAMDSVKIWVDQDKNEKQPLTHAKVWLTETQVAIGSWNCSYRGTGLNVPLSERNIEAGIISPISNKERNGLLNQLAPAAPHQLKGKGQDELSQEWEQVLNPFTFSCQIIADWNTFTYQLLYESSPDNYTVMLPHEPGKKIALSSVNEQSFLKHYANLLYNRRFSIFDSSGIQVFEGHLLEKGKVDRPVRGYLSFDDLFESLIKDPFKSTANARTRYATDLEDFLVTDDLNLAGFKYSGYQSYYYMFVALQKMEDALGEANQDQLQSLAFRLPGSLINIKGLLEKSIEVALSKLSENPKELEDDLLFHYMFVQEFNLLLKSFNKRAAKLGLQAIDLVEATILDRRLSFNKRDRRFINAQFKPI